MPILLLIYLIGFVTFPIVAGLINRHYEWVTKDDLRADENLPMMIVLAFLLWPITFVVLLAALFYEIIIPG